MKVFLDTETTDLNPGQVCQLSYIVTNEKLEVMKSRNYFFKIEHMSEGAESVHGFSKEKLEILSNGTEFKHMADEIFNDLSGKELICHNVTFDYRFMKTEFFRCGIEYGVPTFCTMDYLTPIVAIPSPYYEGQYKWPRLSEALDYFSIDGKTDVIDKAKSLFKSSDVGFHDSRFDVAGLYLIYKKISEEL